MDIISVDHNRRFNFTSVEYLSQLKLNKRVNAVDLESLYCNLVFAYKEKKAQQ